MKILKSAFTILELLIVISVLTILIGISTPKIKGMQQNSNLIKAQREVDTIKSALESYRTFGTTNLFPPSTTTLQATYLITSVPNLINNILYDPFGATSTTEYNYLCSSNKKYYIVWSVGVTGQNQPTAISNTGVVTY